MKTYTPVYFIKKFLIFLIILIPVCVFLMNVTIVRAEDNKTVDDPPRTPGGYPLILDNNTWPTQILYDTIGACYQGTIKWIILSNPNLIGQMPGPAAQRQMVEHCFCVIDKVRKELTYQEYIKKVANLDWTAKLFMSKAVECVTDYETLPSFFMTMPDAFPKTNDNGTINEIPEDKPKDSQDEPPGLKPKESENGLPETIFQG